MIKKVVAAAAATGGLVLAGAGLAVADSGAQGAAVHSPGVVSGNVIQVLTNLSFSGGNPGDFAREELRVFVF